VARCCPEPTCPLLEERDIRALNTEAPTEFGTSADLAGVSRLSNRKMWYVRQAKGVARGQ
jgi:hypothetical protein